MSKIIFQFNKDKNILSKKTEKLSIGLTEICISFCSDKHMTHIKGIRFGYELFKDDERIHRNDYPPRAVVYEYTDKSPIVTAPFELEADTRYTVIGWVEIPGKPRIQEQVEIDNMYPDKPFPSWQWNGTEWEAPKPKKFDAPYIWNESSQEWEIDEMTPFVSTPGYEVE